MIFAKMKKTWSRHSIEKFKKHLDHVYITSILCDVKSRSRKIFLEKADFKKDV